LAITVPAARGAVAVTLFALLLLGCHQGEDHPLYEWEMAIP